DHPSCEVCPGEEYTVQVINALMSSPHWSQMAIVLAWDDWGGFYDHVPPPVEKCSNGNFYSPGFRLPAILISAYAKQGVVVHDVTEQASVPKLASDLWGARTLHSIHPYARDEKAGSMMGAFDFH